MLIYEKLVDGVRRVYGSESNIPTENDVEIVYKNSQGQAVELSRTSDLRDNGHGGMTLNGEPITAWMGDTKIIPSGLKVAATVSTDIASKTWVAGSSSYVEFSVSTIANDDAGIMVVGKSDFAETYGDKLSSIQYKEGTAWKDLTGGTFGPSTGFPMMNATSNFRAKFKADAAGDYTFNINMVKAADQTQKVCSISVAFTVAAPATKKQAVAVEEK